MINRSSHILQMNASDIRWNSEKLLSGFTQWHYLSKWGLTDARLLLIENLYQYHARQPEISWRLNNFSWSDVLQNVWIRITSNFIVRVEYARSVLNALKPDFLYRALKYIEFSWKMNLKINWTCHCLISNVLFDHGNAWGQIVFLPWFFLISATYFNAVFSLRFNFNCR